ncbi:MAG: hypothetical protein VKN60_10625 [Cyanobacteriota bacterium]|nr:hypothetical protein [Cyanobacteriota bacterium]
MFSFAVPKPLFFFHLLWGLFLLPSLGLLIQIGLDRSLDQRLLTLGFALLALDQGRMAALDFRQIEAVQVKFQPAPEVLGRFHLLIWSAVIWELIGFYLGLFSLGWGILTVLSSQVWFNAWAPIRLLPEREPPIETRPWLEKLGVLAADLLGCGLILLWIWDIAPLTIVLGLWSVALLYGAVKLWQGRFQILQNTKPNLH